MDPKQLGPYRITGTLGHGGMGAVYSAVNEETGEPAAVKILSAGMSGHRDFRHRFEAEIDALRKLRHPNIVRLFGFGEQDGILFYAMELVEGSSLDQELLRGRLFSWREVAEIGIQTCRALRHAHDRGVIHRDIKPANLLLTTDGQVKLSDFGIARLFGNPGLTTAGNVLGTVEFMAPEQADGRPVGPFTDLYSLGAVFFTLLAGRPPFQGANPFKVLEKQRSARPEPVRRYAPAVPGEMEILIAELLEKDPADRIANASLLQRRLQSMLHALARVPDQSHASMGQAPVAGNDLPQPSVARGTGGQQPLPETRVFEGLRDGGGAVPRAPIVPQSVDAGETRVTSAFDAYKKRSSPAPDASATSPGSPGSAEAKPAEAEGGARTTGHFTLVAEKDLDQGEEELRPPALISPHTWALAIALIVLGLFAWYLLRPPSDEALYRRIMSTTADHKITSLRAARRDISQFLMRHPNDPVCRRLLREIDLADKRRELEQSARERGGAWHNLAPIERGYVEALEIGEHDPQQAIKMLESIRDLYGDRVDDSGPTGLCLELVQRKLVEFRDELETRRNSDLAVLELRLDRADEFDRSGSPDGKQTARKIRQAVVDLYGDKAWAKEVVDRAREALKEHGAR